MSRNIFVTPAKSRSVGMPKTEREDKKIEDFRILKVRT